MLLFLKIPFIPPPTVIPAKAGIHFQNMIAWRYPYSLAMDPRFRGDDDWWGNGVSHYIEMWQ
jgi:hypothetical protein